MTGIRLSLAAAMLLAALPLAPARAQSSGLDLTVNHVGIGIGHVRQVTGIRLNFRDRDDVDVKGINATIWSPEGEARGNVTGLALGLPMTGAGRITGIAAGVFGVSATDRITGLGIGGIGVGAGGRLDGIMIGGIGVGAGGDVTGLTLGGIGVGAGGSLRGISIGGIGVGGGGSVRGISIGGIGVGAAADVTGLTVAGIGVGSGGTLRGISVAGVGVGAPRIEGFAMAPAVGAESARAVIIAPAYMRIDHGTFTGISVSAFNHVQGTQHGLTIGVFNYARRLHGVQVGVLNYARSNRAPFRLLPLVNFGREGR